MTKQKSTSAFQTIEEAKAQCRRAKGKQEYAVAERWLKKFKFWYSPTGKRYKAPASAIAIYSYIAGLNEQGKECYANQDTLGEIGSVEPRQVRNIIKMLEDVGVVHVDRRKGQTSICTALPFTDAHVIPPDQLSAAPESDVVRQQPEPMPAPEPATAEELNVPDLDDIPFAWDEPEEQLTPTIPIHEDRPELPWGGRKAFKPNGHVSDEGLRWALTETMGDEVEAYRLLSRVVSERLGREVVIEPQAEEDSDDIPFF